MKAYLYASTASLITIMAAGLAAPAYAQDTAAQAEAATDESAIVVTARRREELLQDVPISMTVYNQEQLTQRNVAVATDLATYTPSLSVNQRYGPEKSSFSIRGFVQDQSTAPTVGVYFAEVVGVRAQGGTTSGNTVGAGSFIDLQNVQILKGPQGTLFGRNTTGGAIMLTPRKPTDEFGGYIEGTYGNYDQFRMGGAINVPVAEGLKFRVAAERNIRDGYMKNQIDRGPDAYNDVNYWYARFSMVADITSNIENYTVLHYSNSDTNGYASRITGCATPTSPIGPLNIVQGSQGYSGTRHLQAASCPIQRARQTARGDSLYEIETRNPNPFLKVKQWQAINTTTWRASDAITIKNIMSYGEFRERANFDLGSSNFVVPAVDPSPFPGDPRMGFRVNRIDPRLTTTGGAPGGIPLFAAAGTPYDRIVLDTACDDCHNSAQKTFTEELQFQIDTEKFNAVVGGYLEFSRPIGFSEGRTGIFLDCNRPQNLDCTNPLFFGSISESSTKLKFDNHGIFAQGTYNFTEQWALTAGVRYTFDKITGFTQGTRLAFANASTPNPFVDPISGKLVGRSCTDSFRHRHPPGGTTPFPGLDRSVCVTNLTEKSNEPTWLINVDYKPTNDILVYAKYARGYRQGGINFTNPGVETWEPEKMDSFEIGGKTSFRGSIPGYFNAALFYNKLSNYQVFGGLVASPQGAAAGVAGGAGIINVGKARSWGLEIDASALFFDSLRMTLGYTYLNTKVKELATPEELAARLVGTPFNQFIPRVTVGGPFNDSPKHKLTITGSYTLPLDESIGEVTFGATWVYTSKYINDGSVPAEVDGIPLGVTPSNNLLNLNLDWNKIAGSNFDAALFVTNLTKEEYNVSNTGAWFSAGVAEILLNQPRFYGARLRFNY